MKINEDKITPTVIDLHAAKQRKLDESWLAMFGGAIKMVLRRMFGESKIPIHVKGKKSDIKVFAEVLNREKKYMRAYSDLGPNSYATTRSRYELDNAVKRFEEKTGITWPLK